MMLKPNQDVFEVQQIKPIILNEFSLKIKKINL